MKWFDNPRKRRRSPSKRRKAKRHPPKGFRSWKAYMASIRPKGKHMARRKRRSTKKRNAPRRRSHRRARARTSVTVRSNPRRSVRRYRRRHNPRFSIKGVLARGMTAAQDGLWIVGGKIVTNALPTLIGLSPVGALGIGIKALAAVGAGILFDFVSPNAGKLAAAAGFATIYEPFIKGLNIPIVSPALAADDGYDSLEAYPDEVGTLSAYPNQGGVGAYPSDFAQQY